MSYVIGIDTGGTYTDAVLLDSSKQGEARVERKAKAFTTHDELEKGIRNSIANLRLSDSERKQIKKVVLSTTLATNAIVEGKISKVGLILIGEAPRGKLASEFVNQISGSVNIKGSVLLHITPGEVAQAVKELMPHVDSIAVSGMASVRNPVLEQSVRKIINNMCELPVVCGHELVSNLGFLERTNTAIINAGLLPIINNFVKAIKAVLKENNISAPVFVVKGDGSIIKIDVIKKTPVDTVLSGPASSIIGAINLTGLDDAIVADMGGTTTDTGIVRKKRVELSLEGALVGSWKIRIKSAKLYTFGLGGDSDIKLIDGAIKVGPERVLPACRGGQDTVTPTDILHYTEEFVEWDKERAAASIEKQASKAGLHTDEYVSRVKDAVADKIYDNVSEYGISELPIVAIGAPAESWYHIAREKYAFKLVVPRHYEVANAVGAATAGIHAEVEAIIRPGEQGFGYLVHTKIGRYSFKEKEKALLKAIEVTRECAEKIITDQNLEIASVSCMCEDIYNSRGQLICEQIDIQSDGEINLNKVVTPGKYLETRIKIMATGKDLFYQAAN